MQSRTKNRVLLLLAMMAVSSGAAVATAQAVDAARSGAHAELALEYNYVRANAGPGECGCFNLNGGSATFAWPVRSGSFALAGDASITHAGAISSNGYSLTLSAFTAGVRYTPRLHYLPLRPFGQVLVGVAHASGSLVEGINPAASNAGAAFASNVGGGIDLRATHHLSLRLIEADYLLTTFDNGGNDHQNNFRLGAGVVFRF